MRLERKKWDVLSYSEYMEFLLSLSEEGFADFQRKLIPGTGKLIGIRTPELKKIAKEIAKGDVESFLSTARHEYFEETMMCGFVIGCAKKEIGEIMAMVRNFVPRINNWAVCDQFCGALKITKKEKEAFLPFLLQYRESPHAYELRFLAVMLMNYYLDEMNLPLLFEIFDEIKHDDYYVKMAVAWAISVCLIKFYEESLCYLQTSELDDFTFQKGLTKAVESYRISPERKEMLKEMRKKRKRNGAK